MTHHKPILAVILGLAVSAGCKQAKEEAGNAMANAIVNHELAKHGEHMDMGAMQNAAQTMKAIQDAPKRPTVDFKKIQALLPDAPAGWTANAPEGRSIATPQMQMSEASRHYQKGNAQVTLKVTDGMAQAAAMLVMMAGVTEESSNGYRKPYNLGGGVGTEQWTIASKSANIELMTKNHFLIDCEGSGLDGSQVAKDLVAKLDPTKVDALVP